MQNLGTAAAAMTAAILLGNMLSMPLFRPIALKLFGFGLAVGLIVAVFFYCSQRYSSVVGWLAAAVVLVVSLALVGMLI